MKNMNTHSKMIIGGVILAGIFFSGGVAYGKGHTASAQTAGGARGAAGAQFAARGGARGAGGAAGGGFVTGTVLSKDALSFTVSTMGGGSKIVFLGTATPVTKTVSGSSADLVTGANVMVTGQTNTDGSVTARSVELRPAPVVRTISNQ